MSAEVILEWTYSPRDYFEDVIEISRNDYTMKIANGTVQANVETAIYDENPSMRQELHNALIGRFMGVQLLIHRAYELSSSKLTRIRTDGRKDYFVHIEAAAVAVSVANLDIRVIDKHGNVASDSKRDRVESKERVAELVATHRPIDRLLASLLQSYEEAVHDPNDELVHLYEIRDALSKEFGGDKKARSILGISSSNWSRFGQICNDKPLRQGRHRGRADRELRDASEGELADARRIARAMVEAYLHRLADPTGP